VPWPLRVGPYCFGFFSNENLQPPHVHVIRDDCKAKFWLNPVCRLEWNVGFRGHELTRMRKIIERNRNFLLEKWHEHHNR
jgi:hypothetical protein